MRILLDAQGGDNAPLANIRGAIAFAKQTTATVVLIGKQEVIEPLLKENGGANLKNIEIIHASETVEMYDIPTKAIKTKKDSSMVKGLNLLKDGQVDAFVSAGNTGALLTGATFVVGRIKNVLRPVIAATLPCMDKEYMLCDAGANTNCKIENFEQFAKMTATYLTYTKNIARPKVGLLNIGTEETKGNELYKEVFAHMNAHKDEYPFEFVGNIEGRDPFTGKVDIVLADGFTGNIFLKTIEGLGKLIKESLENMVKSIGMKKIFLLPVKDDIKREMSKMDYKKMGGGLFLGVKYPVVKAHGSSDEVAFFYTLKQAEDFVNANVIGKITELMEKETPKRVISHGEEHKDSKENVEEVIEVVEVQ